MAKAFDVDTGGTLTTSLRAWYNLESDGTDEYTNGYNMTVVGSPTFGTGKIGNAVSCTAGKYLDIASNWGIDGGACSLSFFVRITTAPGSNVFYPLVTQWSDEGGGGTNVNYSVYYKDVAGVKKVVFDRTKNSVAAQELIINTTLTTNTWYHLVMTYDTTNIEGYIDAASQGTLAASGNGTGSNVSHCVIGTEYNNIGGQEAEADIDLVGVWSKALSSTEVSDLRNGGNGNAYREQPLASGNAFFMGANF